MNSRSSYLLSVVIPVYNEEEVLPEFHRRLSTVLAKLDDNFEYEVIYTNDGSSDRTLELINSIYDEDEHICIVDLSRNFGKEIALTAGLHKAQGDAVIVIDADLQDPPELIPQLLQQWREGYDVVYAKREHREGESTFKKISAHLFYRLMSRLGRVKLPEDTGDYRLLSRRALDALNTLTEQHRFMKGLFTWIGYRQKAVYYKRDPRHSGVSKWSYWRLWNLAIEGITSFTDVPLKFATYFGFVTALGAFTFGLFIIGRTILFGNPVEGYPSLIVIILFLGGVQLMSIGILGEYIGRIFTETKRRPLYFLNEYKSRRSNSNTK